MNDEEQLQRIKKLLRSTFVVATIIVTVGSVFYHFAEKLSWLDSIYFSVITLATVGYGDITPHTNIGKIFTIFYVLIGIGIIATFANLLLKRTAIIHYQKKFKK